MCPLDSKITYSVFYVYLCSCTILRVILLVSFMCTYVHVLYCVLFYWYLLCVLMFMYYTACYFTGIFYAVVRQISMLFIGNKDSVFCTVFS